MTRHNKNLFIFAAVLFILLLAAYSNHFHNGFHFDDSHTIEDNVHIRNLSNIPAFFSDPKMFSNAPDHWGIRAFVTTTLAIDYHLAGGLNPFWYQVDTFVWYVLLCVLLYFMYQKLLKGTVDDTWAAYTAMGATAWYTLHAANAETINYVIARSDVLSTLCIIAALLIYIAWPAKRKVYLYLIPAVIGVFAKETMLVLVILVFFYDLLFDQGLSIYDVFKKTHFKQLLTSFVRALPLLIVVGIVQYYTLSKAPGVPGISNPFFYYLLTQSYVWSHYFISFFLPMNMSADSDWTVITNVFDERIILGLVFVVVLVIGIFKTSKNKSTKPVSFGLIWFAAALLPTSLAPFAEVTNDHRMFFPFVGLALSVVTAIAVWLMQHETVFSKYKTIIFALAALVLLLNVYGIRQRNKVWRTEESLWLDVTQKSPLNGRGLMNYGLTQMGKGNYAEAGIYFTKALSFLPNYSTLYINLGILNGAVNKNQEADANFQKAISLNPNSFDGYAFYARYLQNNGRLADARLLAEKALQLNPYSTMTLSVLMPVYEGLGAWTDLQQTAAKALQITPGDSTAQLYAEAARQRKPVFLINSSKNNKALTAADYLNLSLAYYNRKEYDHCIAECVEAIKLKPDYADAYSNMGAAYNQLGQWDKAIEACTKALQINPNHQLAAGNLNWAKTQSKH